MRTKGKKLAKAALAKTNTIQVSIEGDYEDSRQRFNSLSTALGVTYDGNNNVVDEQIVDDVALLQSQVLSLVTLLNSTFNGLGNIDVDGYSSHTHDYNDGTIADTDDGTGTQTDTNRTTGGVN